MAVPSAAAELPTRELTAESLFEIVRATSHARPRTDEPPAKFLARQTHLRLQGKRLSSCALPAGTCPQLSTLYLYDNELDSLEGLGSVPQLTHLYLQNNRIASVASDIGNLRSLRKLYLSGNCLSSLEPLASLDGLQELHVSSQRLPPGTTLDLCQAALAQMRSLRVLALAKNRLQNVNALAACRSLMVVDLRDNLLGGLDAIAGLITSSAPLTELDLRENGVSSSRQTIDSIIVACPTVVKLNDRELSQSERAFLQQLHLRGKRPQPWAGGPPAAMA